ncbi:beta-N-acetylhexosaminidase [Paractinoplanes tereljensis]|uniref:beta-N-acetylhexosaminidase n=1 Tax=Paractinoplanes tereljensis TaxID=571912 RepID=A0A919TPR0_9ACTN|nr:beta-N-acetylhexosaminidase [Actinoplanes tereljensis]
MIPRPSEVRPSSGTFVLGPDARLSLGEGLGGVAGWLREELVLDLPLGESAAVRLEIDPGLPSEGYALRVAADGISVAGGSAAGVFYGAQTLRQLLPPAALRRAGSWPVPFTDISDSPRFPWRGVMLDVARHFMPVADVLRFVDLAAFHKLNVLHLHLTDDQGWRIEVPGWPRLTSVGAWRPETMLGSRVHGRYDGRPHGGFYTADDLRRIVAYAAERCVTVVPEVDMPGHMQAAIAAYPSLGNGYRGPVRTGWGISTHVLNLSAESLSFCRDVLSFVCEIFPSPLIGIGGDECPADEWADSPVIGREGLAGPAELHGWFTAQMASFLAERGRRVFGWDELLAYGVPAKAVIAAWRGVPPTVLAAQAGVSVVSCPDISCYLDYRQSDDPGEPTPVGTRLTLADVYRFDPVPAGLPGAAAANVLGGQANVWTEHMESARRVDYMTYPRLCAFAETVWSSAARDFADFSARLAAHLPRLDALGVNYRPMTGPRPQDARPDAPGHPRSLPDRLAELHEMTADLRR